MSCLKGHLGILFYQQNSSAIGVYFGDGGALYCFQPGDTPWIRSGRMYGRAESILFPHIYQLLRQACDLRIAETETTPQSVGAFSI